MPMLPNPTGRWRRNHATDPEGPEQPHQAALRGHRQVAVTFHPMVRSTLATVIVTDWQGHRRWDRRSGTLILGASLHDLAGQDLAETLRILLREALENLS